MKFDRRGYTRFVILTNCYAIKIARLPIGAPFVPLWTLIRVLWNGTLIEKMKKHRGRVLEEMTGRIHRRITHSGIAANRQEVRLAKQCPHYPIAPIVHSLFWGYVIVMQRGEPVEEFPTGWDRRHELPPHLTDSDLFMPYHTCRFDGRS